MRSSKDFISTLKALPHICDPLEEVSGESVIRARLVLEGSNKCIYVFHYALDLGLWLGMVEIHPGVMEFRYFSNLEFIKSADLGVAHTREMKKKTPTYPQIDPNWTPTPLKKVSLSNPFPRAQVLPLLTNLIDSLSELRTSLNT